VSKVPIWASPPPGSRKPRFTRDQIATAALEIADKEGFEELSMRRIAEALGAGTMTLYYYVRTKEDVLSLMDDALMGEVVARSHPLPKGWRAAVETIARATVQTYTRHSWALVGLEGARVGPHNLRHIEQSLEAVETLPLPLAGKLELLSIVDDFVFGTVLREREMDVVDSRTAGVLNLMSKEILASGDYPRLSKLIGNREPIEAFAEFAIHMTKHDRFERGLAMLLDGFTAMYRLDRPAKKRRKR
jgi:AcrR family transcriptional regulator